MKVTGWPRNVGLTDAVSIVDVAIGLTLSFSGAETEGVLFTSPE